MFLSIKNILISEEEILFQEARRLQQVLDGFALKDLLESALM